MPTLPFGEYRPDLSDLDGTHSRSLRDVIPQGDGYGPIRDIAALTAARPDVVVSANVGCTLHLAAASNVPVKHWIEILSPEET